MSLNDKLTELNHSSESFTREEVREAVKELIEILFEEAIKRKVPLDDMTLDRLPLDKIDIIIKEVFGEKLT